jgi:hypothetical protein
MDLQDIGYWKKYLLKRLINWAIRKLKIKIKPHWDVLMAEVGYCIEISIKEVISSTPFSRAAATSPGLRLDLVLVPSEEFWGCTNQRFKQYLKSNSKYGYVKSEINDNEIDSIVDLLDRRIWQWYMNSGRSKEVKFYRGGTSFFMCLSERNVVLRINGNYENLAVVPLASRTVFPHEKISNRRLYRELDRKTNDFIKENAGQLTWDPSKIPDWPC